MIFKIIFKGAKFAKNTINATHASRPKKATTILWIWPRLRLAMMFAKNYKKWKFKIKKLAYLVQTSNQRLMKRAVRVHESNYCHPTSSISTKFSHIATIVSMPIAILRTVQNSKNNYSTTNPAASQRNTMSARCAINFSVASSSIMQRTVKSLHTVQY